MASKLSVHTGIKASVTKQHNNPEHRNAWDSQSFVIIFKRTGARFSAGRTGRLENGNPAEGRDDTSMSES